MAEGGVDHALASEESAKTKISAGPEFLETPEGRRLAYHKLPGQR